MKKKLKQKKLEKEEVGVASNLDVPETAEVVRSAEELEAEKLEAEKQQGKIEEAKETVVKQKSKKKKVLNSILFAVNIVVVALILWMQISQEQVISVADLRINAGYLIALILIFGFLMVAETLAIDILMKKGTGRARPALSFKTASIGRYYDSITPMSTGGQPFQIFYLKSRDIPSATALSIPMSKYIYTQIVWVVISFFVLVTGVRGSTAGEQVVSVAAILGFIFSFALIAFVVVVSLSKSFGRKMVKFVVKALQKGKLVKDFDKAYNKIMNMVSDYQKVVKSINDEKFYSFMMILISIGIFLLKYTIPSFVYATFTSGGVNFTTWAEIFSMCIMIDLAASFVPMPGGTGVSELSFTALFTMFFVDGTLFWAMLLWRFMTFYIYIIQGVLVLAYDYLYGNKKYLWTKKSWNLQCESKAFRQVQIQKFRNERNKMRRR